MWLSFFEWLASADNVELERFSEDHNNSIRALCELMGETWMSIQLMPYIYFQGTVKWKMDLEEQKRKAMEERNREQEAEYKRRMNAQRAAERKAARRK